MEIFFLPSLLISPVQELVWEFLVWFIACLLRLFWTPKPGLFSLDLPFWVLVLLCSGQHRLGIGSSLSLISRGTSLQSTQMKTRVGEILGSFGLKFHVEISSFRALLQSSLLIGNLMAFLVLPDGDSISGDFDFYFIFRIYCIHRKQQY